MLLVTGSLLVVIGLALGVTACRSVSEHKRKRRRQQMMMMSSSGVMPLYSLVNRRRTSASGSSLTSSPSFIVPSRRSNGKKRSLEKTVSPILEASGEYESLECERLAVEIHHASNTSVRDISLSVSAEVVCRPGTSAEPVYQNGLAPDIVCQTSLSSEVIYQKGLSSQGIGYTSLSKEGIGQTSLSTEALFQTSSSTEAVCQSGLSSEVVDPESVMVDSGGYANLLTNDVLYVDSLTEGPCRPRLSFPRSRIKCNSDKMLPCESSAPVEITVVDVEHETAFITEDDTGPLAETIKNSV